MTYEYSGVTHRKRKEDVKSKLFFGKGISRARIVKVSFNKRPTKYGWKFRAVVKEKPKK